MSLASLLVVLAIFYIVKHKETPTSSYQGASCDLALWEHVYHGTFPTVQDRLSVVNACITVSGVIEYARKESDGDWHIQLDLDQEFTSLLNDANFDKQQGDLVLEPICSNPVTQRDTIEEGVCEGFTQDIFSPDMIGQRVSVTGAYVIDNNHGWAEIHPVTSIAPIN